MHDEVAAYNTRQDGLFHGLVQPTESERVLNGYRLRPTKRIDAEQQVTARSKPSRATAFSCS